MRVAKYSYRMCTGADDQKSEQCSEMSEQKGKHREDESDGDGERNDNDNDERDRIRIR